MQQKSVLVGARLKANCVKKYTVRSNDQEIS